MKGMYRACSNIFKCCAVVIVILVCVHIFISMFASRRTVSLGHVLGAKDASRVNTLVTLAKYTTHKINTNLTLVKSTSNDIKKHVKNTDTTNKINKLANLEKSDGFTNSFNKQITKTMQNKTDQVVNPHPFRYLLNPVKFCSKKDIFIITYIHSSPDHSENREAIRQTWASETYVLNRHFKVLFILGQVADNTVMSSVRKESDRFGDIVQEDFDDSYKNLTYKGIAGLKWVSTYCRHAKYVLKTDDDIFVNMYNLLKYINTSIESSDQKTNLILCNLWTNNAVIRDKSSKWYVSKQEFPPKVYPPYCSGSAFLLSSDVAERLYERSFYTRFVWVDDYYITGALVSKLNITYTQYSPAYGFYSEKNNNLTFTHLNQAKKTKMLEFWNNLLKIRRQNETHK